MHALYGLLAVLAYTLQFLPTPYSLLRPLESPANPGHTAIPHALRLSRRFPVCLTILINVYRIGPGGPIRSPPSNLTYDTQDRDLRYHPFLSSWHYPYRPCGAPGRFGTLEQEERSQP